MRARIPRRDLIDDAGNLDRDARRRERFLLVGIAVSPLAWVALVHRRSRFEQKMEARLRETVDRLESLEARLEIIDMSSKEQAAAGKLSADRLVPHGPHWSRPVQARPKRAEGTGGDLAPAPTLIAVPSLAAPPNERKPRSMGCLTVTRRSGAWPTRAPLLT